MDNDKLNSGVRDSAGKIIFRDKQHEDFYYQYLKKCRYHDEYHRALVYCLGIDRDTREHVDRIYDFKTGLVRPRCLREGWQTSGSVKIVRLAFNLYCNNMPSVTDRMKKDEIMREACLAWRKFSAAVMPVIFGRQSGSAIRMSAAMWKTGIGILMNPTAFMMWHFNKRKE